MAHETESSAPAILPEEKQTLSQRINTSTKSIYTHLNRLILARLPLALPPYSICPSTYVFGLLYIAPIYIAFESLWQELMDAKCQPSDDGCVGDDMDPIDSQSSECRNISAKKCCHRHGILSNLQVEGLKRSERLRTDIETLSGISDQDVEEQLLGISQHGKVSIFIAHTTRSVNASPHVLLAYAWVLYMALFAGGRHLRALLQNAGSDFWNRSQGLSHHQRSKHRSIPGLTEGGKRKPENYARRQTRGLDFFHFPGEEDGEDIKRHIKRRFTEVEALLSDREKDDIVCEAQHIFAFLVELIGELDHEQLSRRQGGPPKTKMWAFSGRSPGPGIWVSIVLVVLVVPVQHIDVKLGQRVALTSLLAFLVWCF